MDISRLAGNRPRRAVIACLFGLLTAGVLIGPGMAWASPHPFQAAARDPGDVVDQVMHWVEAEFGPSLESWGARLDPTPMIDALDTAAEPGGVQLDRVRAEVKAFKSNNLAFQAIVDGLGKTVRDKLIAGGLTTAQARAVTADFESGFHAAFPKNLTPARARLADAVLESAEAFQRAKGHYEFVDDQFVFDSQGHLNAYNKSSDQLNRRIDELDRIVTEQQAKDDAAD